MRIHVGAPQVNPSPAPENQETKPVPAPQIQATKPIRRRTTFGDVYKLINPLPWVLLILLILRLFK